MLGRLVPETAWLRVCLTQRKFEKRNINDLPSADRPHDCYTRQWRTERGGFGVFKPPPRNSEDIGGVLDRMSKKSRRLDFLLQFTVFSYGCNLLNKGFF